MAVRYRRIDSEQARDAAEWAITVMRNWFEVWEKEKNKSPHSLSNSEITRFINIYWAGGKPFPSVPNWDQDVLSLCELLCVATKTFYPTQEKADGGALLWLLNGIIEAIKGWNIISGDEELEDIVRMIQWMEEFLTNNQYNSLNTKAYEMRESIVMAFSNCDPDLTHDRTLEAYSAILGSVSPFFLEFMNRSPMESILGKLIKISNEITELMRNSSGLSVVNKVLLERCGYIVRKFHKQDYFPQTYGIYGGCVTIPSILGEAMRILRDGGKHEIEQCLPFSTGKEVTRELINMTLRG